MENANTGKGGLFMVVLYIIGGIAVAEWLFAFFGAALPLIRDKRRKGEKRV